MQLEILARHWTEAGEIEHAIGAWQRAGEHAVEHRAYREAEHNYHNAIGGLQQLPEWTERDRRELSLQLALGEVMTATKGFGAVETEAAYARARALAERTGEAQSLGILFGLSSTACSRGELRLAQSLSEQILALVGSVDNPPALHTANFTYALCRHYLGALDEAREHFLKAIRQYREDDFRELPNDPGINALLWTGVNEWYSGYPTRGLRNLDDARLLARRLNKPLGLAFTQALGALTYALCGDLERALSDIQEAQRLGTELRFPWFEVQGKVAGAWIRAKMGEQIGAPELIRAGITEWDSQKFFLARSWNLWVFAEAQAIAGPVDDALITLGQALETNPDELLYRPLALRLRGDLRRCKTYDGVQYEFAEQDFREAINLSRRMSAKSLELRATTSLARLLRDTGRRNEARTQLAEIYNWFTEGFDTADLKDAKALLDELGN